MRYASRPSVCLVAFVSVVALVSAVPRVSAQTADAIGTRAQGMGGAFTAVADDATATWWNPAGLAGGAYFSALIESSRHQQPPDDRTAAGDPQSAWRVHVTDLAVAFPALGLSYYRLQVSEIQPQTSTGATPAVRQDGGATEVRLRSLDVSQFGATVGQSLGSHVVVGSTLKLVHAGAVSRSQPASDSSLDAAESLGPSGDTHGGLDVGAMTEFGPVRIGVMVRNVSETEFGDGSDRFTLSRQARIGGAVTTGSRGVIGSATVAVDADLTKTTTVFGEERRLAAGGELWTSSRTFGVRGGVGVNTIGERGTSLSGGFSVAVKKSLYADGELSGGTDRGRQGWGVALRLTF